MDKQIHFGAVDSDFASNCPTKMPQLNFGEVMLLKQAYMLLDELVKDNDLTPKVSNGLQTVGSLLRAQCSLTRSAQELRHSSDAANLARQRKGGARQSQRQQSKPRRRPTRNTSKKETKTEQTNNVEATEEDASADVDVDADVDADADADVEINPKNRKSNLLHRAMLLRIRRNMSLATWTTTTTATGLPSLESAPNTKRSSNLIAKQWARGGSDHCRALRNLILSRKQSIDTRGNRSTSPSPMTCEASPSSPECMHVHGSCLSRKSSCQSVNRLSVSSAPNTDSVPTSPNGPPSTGSTPSASLLAIPHSHNGSMCNVTSPLSGTPSPTESPRKRSVSIIVSRNCLSNARSTPVRHASQSAGGHSDRAHLRKGFSPQRNAELSVHRRFTPESSDSSDSHAQAAAATFSIKELHRHVMLSNSELKKWDYQLFDAERELGDFTLSKLALKIFHDVGLLQCFKVPVDRFIAFFHTIESTYGRNAYHNKLHAADVLHGSAYLTTQPVPGLKVAQTGIPSDTSSGRLGPPASPTTETRTDSNSPTSRQGFCNFKVDATSFPFPDASPPGDAAASVSASGNGSATGDQSPAAGATATSNNSSLQPTPTTTEPFQLRNPLHKVNSNGYGVIGSNLIALELLALYSAAILHDYDHPGRTNAYLVATQHPLAILYNDRSVLENHHAAHAWALLISRKEFNWLCDLDEAELKRFRFLFIEIILATDLKRHFEFLTEWTSKFCNEDGESGIDWFSETDRLLVLQMLIKLADLNGPTKAKDLHLNWVSRITEEFYLQGDEEAKNGLPISPHMNRKDPQLAKLQVTFIDHVVSPLCSALFCSRLLPGYWSSHKVQAVSSSTETDDSAVVSDSPVAVTGQKKDTRQIECVIMQNLRKNQAMWTELVSDDEKWTMSPANTTSTAAPDDVKHNNSNSSNSNRDRNSSAPQSSPVGTDKISLGTCLADCSAEHCFGQMRERSKTISMPSSRSLRSLNQYSGNAGPNPGAESSASNLRILTLKSGAMQKYLQTHRQERQSLQQRRQQHRSTLGGALPFTHELKSQNEPNEGDAVATLVVPSTVNSKLTELTIPIPVDSPHSPTNFDTKPKN